MADEAVKSLRRLFLGSLVIVLVWIISWPVAIERFKRYRDARQLHAWLFLKERMDNFDRKFDSIHEEVIDEVIYNKDRRESTESMKIEFNWPRVDRYNLSLHRKFSCSCEGYQEKQDSCVKVYKPECSIDLDKDSDKDSDPDKDPLPFSNYYIVFIRDESPRVVSTLEEVVLRSLETNNLDEIIKETGRLNKPRDWDSIGLRLKHYGFKEQISKLTSTTAELKKFQEDSDPNKLMVQIFGVQFKIGIFFSSVGVFLGIIAFAMIGPVLTLRRSRDTQNSHPWVMIISTLGGFMNDILEAAIVGVSLLWSVFPLVLLGIQYYSDIELGAGETKAMFIGMLGLIFSSIIFSWTSIELRKVRRSRIIS